jgi:RNA polymerase subunit RPABC4/transcription elongation factor Spt4
MSLIEEMKRRRDQVALEADKLLRTNRKQGEIGQWRKQIEQSVVQLGNAALGLYSLGVPLPPELAAVCQQIDALNAQILEAEQEIERIRQESLPDPAAVSGLRCQVCGYGIPEAATFCPNCGNPRPKPSLACANCGNALPPDARFCASCGQRVTVAGPDPEPPANTVACASCQAEILTSAVFCPLCGTPTAAAPT